MKSSPPNLKAGLAILAVLLAVLAYGGTYWWLRDRGLRDAENWGIKGFYYVPVIAGDISDESMQRHLRLVVVFAPANWIDQLLVAGPLPAAEPLRGLE
jgi:hypothetical protein